VAADINPLTPQAPRQAERTYYPGMRPREGAIFRQWLLRHESEYERFEYNVRVGPGRDPGSEFDEATRKAGIESSQKRIDAIAWAGGRATIIEVKDFALELAIGQVLQYASLWATYQQGVPGPAARLLIVCVHGQYGLQQMAAAAGVDVEYVA
jgi:hypothetical protein